MNIDEIKYGHINIEGTEVGYATWLENGKKHEVIVPPFRNIIKVINGKQTKPTKEDVMIWTKVAG